MTSALVIRPGTPEDYDRLARFHYRPGRPATSVRVLVAAEQDGGLPVGVLVVSMPAINGPWRAAAWPGSYRPRSPEPAARREALRALNAEVRTISRVIVEPRRRGLGVGVGLVRAYLRDPLTVRTEALAAMGRFCPLFDRAGMTIAPCPPSRRVLRLRAVLRRLKIEPWRLADPASLLARLDPDAAAALLGAVRTFALDHRDTRDRAASDPPELLALAARRVACEPIAYVHDIRTCTGDPHHVA